MLRINLTLSLIIVFLMISSIFAQNTDNNLNIISDEQQKVDHAIKNYKAALESNNWGMI